VNLSGIQTDIAPGQTVTFDVAFQSGTPARFDIAFVNAASGDILGSIPVSVDDFYLYQVVAIDPDNDHLTFSLTEFPPGMALDVATGRLRWDIPPNRSGPADVTVRVADGRGGFDEQSFTIDVRFAGTGEIRGTKFLDADNNGQRSPNSSGEPGLADWIIYLDQNQNGVRDVGERFTVTHENGEYEFEGLAPGTYYVREEVNAGWAQTFPSADGSPDPINAALHVVVLQTGEVVGERDFGNVQVPLSDNKSPRIQSLPLTTAIASDLYRFDARAIDPENNPLTFSLAVSPEGMTVHPTLGTLVWIPREDQLGEHSVVLRVRDDRDGVAVQSFMIAVTLPNNAPVITSSPVTARGAGGA